VELLSLRARVATLALAVLCGCSGGETFSQLGTQFMVVGPPESTSIALQRFDNRCHAVAAVARVDGVVVKPTVDVVQTSSCQPGGCVATSECGLPTWKLPPFTSEVRVEFDDPTPVVIGLAPRSPVAVAPDGTRFPMTVDEPPSHLAVRSGDLVHVELFTAPTCQGAGLESKLSLSVGGVARGLQWNGPELWVEAPGQKGAATFTLFVPRLCVTTCSNASCRGDDAAVAWKVVLDVE